MATDLARGDVVALRSKPSNGVVLYVFGPEWDKTVEVLDVEVGSPYPLQATMPQFLTKLDVRKYNDDDIEVLIAAHSLNLERTITDPGKVRGRDAIADIEKVIRATRRELEQQKGPR